MIMKVVGRKRRRGRWGWGKVWLFRSNTKTGKAISSNLMILNVGLTPGLYWEHLPFNKFYIRIWNIIFEYYHNENFSIYFHHSQNIEYDNVLEIFKYIQYKFISFFQLAFKQDMQCWYPYLNCRLIASKDYMKLIIINILF